MRALERLAEALARELAARHVFAGYIVDSLRRWGWRVQGAPGLRMAAEDLEDYIAEEATWDVTLAVYSDRDLPGHHPRPARWSVEDSSFTLGSGASLSGSPGPVAPHSPGGSSEAPILKAASPGELLYSSEGRVPVVPGYGGPLWYRLAAEGGAEAVVLEGGEGRRSVYGPAMGPPAVVVDSLRKGACRASVEVDAVLGGERSYPAVIAWSGGANEPGPTVLASLTEYTFGPPGDAALKAALATIRRLDDYDEPVRVVAGSRASSTWISAGKWLARLSTEALVLHDSREPSFTPPPPGEGLGAFQAAVLEALRLQGIKPRLEPLCPDPDYYVMLSHGVKTACLGVPSDIWEEVSAALAAAIRVGGLHGELVSTLEKALWLEHAENHVARGDRVGLRHLASLLLGGEAPEDLVEVPLEGRSLGPAPSPSSLPANGEALVEAAEALWGGFPRSRADTVVPFLLVPALVARGYTLRSSLAIAEALVGRLEWRGLLRGLEATGIVEEA